MKLKNLFLIPVLFLGFIFTSHAQTYCPANADFETGTYSNWTYYKGQNNTGPVWSLTSCTHTPSLHTLVSGAATTDPYGGFPPVGYGLYSLRIGKDTASNNADAASYTIHVPTGSTFKLIYRYAIVLEDPGHAASQQPRYEMSVTDSATGIAMPCYSYIISSPSSEPGFVRDGPTDVWFMPWTAATLDLSTMAGKTVIVNFKVGGCTTGGHFGYAYVDMNCGDYNVMTSGCIPGHGVLSAPRSDSLYNWTDSLTYTASYGTVQTISITTPTVNTTYAVIVTPYHTYGCLDTLYYRVVPSNMVTHQARDTSICYGASVKIWGGATDILPLMYSWTPTAGLSCSTCDTALATPPVGVNSYKITTSSTGGCHLTDTVKITVSPVPAAITPIASICAGSSVTLSDAVSGGAWTSGNTGVATIGSSSGIVTGTSAGTSMITYGFAGCQVFYTITVSPIPAPFAGIGSICTGTTATLTDAIAGGVWSSSSTSVATIGSSSGIVSGVNAGTTLITYALGGCIVYTTVTIYSSPGPISGTTAICTGSTATLSSTIGGGIWGSSNTAIATVGITSGTVSAVSAGTSLISYSLGVCSVIIPVTINPVPAVTVFSYNACGNTDTIVANASSGTTFSWLPSTGLSCASCDTTIVSPATTTTYTVTCSNIYGCTNAAAITVNGNRIFGHITFSGPTPDTLDMNVWLIQYNPTDSTIIAVDSTWVCAVDSITYYEFDGIPSGNYMVKAMLLYGSPPGATGYVPTYSLSTPHWYTAATTAHTSGSDSLHINMVYGTVLPGAGFIGGNVYSGAGKGTAGDAPVSGMLIFLENTTSHILTRAYTDGTGAYTFGNLDYGDYIIYPEDYVYRTTPSTVITLSSTTPGANNIDFRQFTGSKIIIPYYYPNAIKTLSNSRQLSIFPNPTNGILNIQWNNGQTGAATIEITDALGIKQYTATIDMYASPGQKQLNVNNLADGIYLISIKSDDIYYCRKLIIAH